MALCLFLTAWTTAQAQTENATDSVAYQVTGHVWDSQAQEDVIQATVMLLRQDSTMVVGGVSDMEGRFTLKAPAPGKYILRISSVGYNNYTQNVTVAVGRNLDLADINLSTDATLLAETTVVGRAPKVVLKEDTFVYNSSAYRAPEGSAVEELVKKIPGADIDDNGNITINGKQVKKIKVDGKEFMTGDTQTALKNLPSSIVDQIKAYDEKSDLARVTGIDDGEEQTVLDFGLKRGMNKGLFGNIDLGIGTHDRYSERGMGAWFNDKYRIMLMGSANNTNDQGFPGGGGRGRFGGGRNGLNAAKMLGLNVNYEVTKLKIDGSIRWNHRNGDVLSKQSTENFVSTVGSFSNARNQNYTRSNSWNGQMRLEWKPDTMTNIMFRPNFSYSTSDGNQMNISATYSADPYDYVESPLEQEALDVLEAQGVMVNSRKNNSITYGKSASANAMVQVNRKLNSRGRNITFQGNVRYGDNDNTSLSFSDVHLYLQKTQAGLDSTYQTNRYNLTPTKNWSYSLQGTYSEPIARSMFLQFSYRYQYSYNKSDRSTYDFSELGEAFFDGVPQRYRGWNPYLSRLTQSIDDYYDQDLSRFSEYKNYIHDLQLTYRWIQPKFQFNAGFMVQPQRSYFIQDYQGVHVDTKRDVVNWSPTLDFRYRFSQVSNLRINYRGSSSQPSMSDLLDIVDDSDPLNITMGNPGLKPSFTNSFRLFYNTYIQNHQRSIMTFVNYSNTRNSISNMVTYDGKTGGRTTRPENINGNWNMQAAFMFNTAIDSLGVWNVNTFTNYSYSNNVGYLSLGNSDSQKNTTRTTTVMERLSLAFRKDWFEIEPNGSFTYTHGRNKLQSTSDLDTWQFSYGVNLNLIFDWGTSLTTGISQNSRRGYNDQSMNTDELIWNAQISQGFLKGKALTVSLQFYDILHRQSTLTRTINAMMRSDTEYNSINSYAMLHVIYRFNLFGGKEARNGMGGPGMGGPGMGGPGGRPGGFGGGRPGGGGGGFGGGRPGGGFGGGGFGGGRF